MLVDWHGARFPGSNEHDGVTCDGGLMAGELEGTETRFGVVDTDHDPSPLVIVCLADDDHRALRAPSCTLAHGSQERLADSAGVPAPEHEHRSVA